VRPLTAQNPAFRALGALALAASIATACLPDPVRDADVIVYVEKDAGAPSEASKPAPTPEAGIDAIGLSTVDASREVSTEASPDAAPDASSATTVRLSGTADLRWTERSIVPANGCPTDRPETPYRTTTCCTKSYALSDTAVSAVQVTVAPGSNTVTVGALPLVYGPKSYWQGVMTWSSSAHCTQILRTVAALSQAPEAPRARSFVGAVSLRCPVAEWNGDEAAYAPYLGTAFVTASYRDLVETAAVDGCESTAKVTLQLGLRP
jgi:hypothetical protein